MFYTKGSIQQHEITHDHTSILIQRLKGKKGKKGKKQHKHTHSKILLACTF